MYLKRGFIPPFLLAKLASCVKNLYTRRRLYCPNRGELALYLKKVDYPTKSVRHIAYRLVGIQALCVLIASCLWLFSSARSSVSALLGGSCAVLPSFYFAKRLFQTTHPQAVKKILRAFYLGEIVKLALSLCFIALVVLVIPISLFAFVTGFVCAQLGFLPAPFFVFTVKNSALTTSSGPIGL